MINYGKVALQKINELYKNEKLNEHELNQKSYQFELDSTNNYFVLSVNSNNEKVYFNLNLNNNVSCKVYINSILQFYKHNFKFATFGLNVQGTQTIKFEFELENNSTCLVQIMGKMQLIEPNVLLTPLNINLFCVKQNENSFNYCSSNSITETITSFNNEQFKTLNGTFLDVSANKNLLIKGDDYCYIINSSGTQISLTNLNINNGVLFDNETGEVDYIVAYLKNGTLNFLMLNRSGSVLASTLNVSLGNSIRVNKICKVVNNVDSLLYLTCVDNNSNVYIVLCNLENNGYIKSISKPIYIGAGELESAIKITSNNFLFALKNSNSIKVLDVNINFDTMLSSTEFSRDYYNTSGVCLIDGDNIVLRYDNSLISVVLS